jgi:hypothetical protein
MRKPINTPADREWLRKLFKLVNTRIALREKLAWAMLSRNEKQENALRLELRSLDHEIQQHEMNREPVYA